MNILALQKAEMFAEFFCGYVYYRGFQRDEEQIQEVKDILSILAGWKFRVERLGFKNSEWVLIIIRSLYMQFLSNP